MDAASWFKFAWTEVKFHNRCIYRQERSLNMTIRLNRARSTPPTFEDWREESLRSLKEGCGCQLCKIFLGVAALSMLYLCLKVFLRKCTLQKYSKYSCPHCTFCHCIFEQLHFTKICNIFLGVPSPLRTVLLLSRYLQGIALSTLYKSLQ